MKLLHFPFLLLSMLAASSLFSPPCSAQEWGGISSLRVETGDFVQSEKGNCAELRITNAGSRKLTLTDLVFRRGQYYIYPSSFPPPALTLGVKDTLTLYICTNWPDQDLPYDTLIIVGDNRPPIAWGFLVDASNSMDSVFLCDGQYTESRISHTKNSLKLFIDSGLVDRPDLGLVDQFTISSYSSLRQGFDIIPFFHNWLPLTSVSAQERTKVKPSIDAIDLVGGTWTGHALRTMIDTLSKSRWPVRTLVLFSDGPTNDPDLSSNPVQDIVNEAVAANVRIMAVRIGNERAQADEYLKTIAEQTGGAFFEAPDCESLTQALKVIYYTGAPFSRDSIALPTGRSLSIPVNTSEKTSRDHLSIISIVPNPAGEAADVFLRSSRTSSGTLSLYSTNGEIVQRRELMLPAGITSQLRLETAGLPTGTYILQVETEEGSIEQTTLVVRPGNR